eukprot:535224-Pleurochrysis_carterae.AAC.1
MAADIALFCESSLWMLLQATGPGPHILNLLLAMWPTAFAFFNQAAASPEDVIDGTLELIIEGVRKEKLTTRARQAALDMACICKLAAGSSLGACGHSAAF